MKYIVMACFMTSQVVWAGVYPVAGLTPDRRPEGAPVISEISDTKHIEQRLLYGIEKPVPESIQGWVGYQGRWFNPFAYPGMTGRYDLRGWHSNSHSGL
jgi:hypothetical protein